MGSGHAPAVGVGDRPATRSVPVTLSHVWVLVAIAIPVVVVLVARMPVVDLAYHLRAGGGWLDTGRIARFDTYTFSAAGLPWLNQQWGAQVVLAALHRAGGWHGLTLLRATLVGATFTLVFLGCRARGASARAAALLTIGSFLLTVPNLVLRPQLLAYPLFAGSVWIVMDRERHPRRMYLLPVVALVWANLHGSFVLAPAIALGAWLGDVLEHRPAPRRTLAIALATAAATLVGPFGPAVWSYAVMLGTNDQVRGVTEWAPTSVASPWGFLLFASAAAVAAFLARLPGRVPWIDLLWLGAAFAIALPAQRGIVWWALTAPVIVAAHLPRSGTTPALRRGSGSMNLALAGAVVALVALAAVRDPGIDPATGTSARLRQASAFQVEAVRDAAGPGARLFVPQPSASWFELALPSVPVFVDSRIELFPDAVWRDYAAIVDGREGWRGVLDRWGIDVVATDPYTEDLRARMEDEPAWREVYADPDRAVFVRR